MYRRIGSTGDAANLQRDIDSLIEWSVRNAVDLNVAKCSIITFRKRDPSDLYTYRINDVQISRVDSINDLGVLATLTTYARKHQGCWVFYESSHLISGTALSF